MTDIRLRLVGTSVVDISAAGRAAIVTDFARPLEPGRIVVARHATPDVVLVLRAAAGLVFETGGVASHGAILAREFAKACVVGVPDAMRLIADGDEVEIDGAKGEVRVRRG